MVKRTVISSELQFQVADVLYEYRRPMAANEIAGILHVPAMHLGSSLSGLHKRRLILQDADRRWVWADIKKAPKFKDVDTEDEFDADFDDLAEWETVHKPNSLRHRLRMYFKDNPGLWFTPEEIAEVFSYANAGAI